jgi:predicted nuclease of predicted toxin-antitoxin system
VPRRFALYTDADIHGPLVDALVQSGWDVLRAIDHFRQGTDDLIHFEEAARLGRVMVANDSDMKALAERWLSQGRPFPGLVWWPRKQYASMSVSQIVRCFEALAEQEEPFAAYPIVFIRHR